MNAAFSKQSTDELIQMAFDSFPSGLLVVDMFGRIAVVNRAVEKLFGYSREELIGQMVEQLAPGYLSASHSMFHRRDAIPLLAEKLSQTFQIQARHKEGRYLPLNVELSYVSALGVSYTLAAVSDVSPIHSLETSPQHISRVEAIGTIASGAVHSLKNILHCILACGELASEGMASNDSKAELLAMMVTAARRGEQLSNRILGYARNNKVVRGQASFAPPVREAIHLLRETLPANIEVRDYLTVDTPLVFADACELQQIAMNLMINAAHSMECGGLLEIRLETSLIEHPAEQTRPYVRLSVTDTGTGIPHELLDHIFKPFFSTKPIGQGTGLGLSITDGIVRSLGGYIKVQTTEGKGTRFDVYLPAVKAESSCVEPEYEIQTDHGTHAIKLGNG